MNRTDMFNLDGRIAIVTGGNGGIGRSIALGLAGAGAAVAIFGRNTDKNAAVLAELQTIGVPAAALEVDVTDRSAAEAQLLGLVMAGNGVQVTDFGVKETDLEDVFLSIVEGGGK